MPVDDPFTTPETIRSGGLLSFTNRLEPSPNMNRFESSPHSLSLIAPSSPTQLKRALKARLEEVQKRLQEAGQLGESLVRQQKELQEKIKEVEEEAAKGGEVSPELREKLTVLEREYNEVHKESTRALLSSKIHNVMDSPHKSSHSSTLQAMGTGSPTKLVAPSRRQRNQPSRSNDIEFATDIAQTLIAEVRKLQAMLQERDETIKAINDERSNLELNAAILDARVRKLEESENRYKEENWQLELVSQEKDIAIQNHGETVTKLQLQMSTLEHEKADYIREIDDLRQSQIKVNDEHEAVIKQHNTEIHQLRTSLATIENDCDKYKRTVEELRQELEESQKAEMRLKHINDELTAQQNNGQDPFQSSQEDDHTPEGTPPASPAKPTPRHGPLEAETLRSSLQHAHRLIANLKNNIHREKTEKAEAKRMYADLKEELDQLKNQGSAPQSAKKPRRDPFNEIKFKKPSRPNLLGATRKPKSEIVLLDQEELENTEWEDENMQPQSPSPTGTRSSGILTRSTTSESYESGFETANEKSYADELQTPSKEYPTSADEMTETESTIGRRSIYSETGSFGKGSVTPLSASKSRDRSSFASIGSEEDDDQPFRLGGYRTLDPEAFQPREEFSPAQASQRLKLRIRNGGIGRLGHRIPSDGSLFRRYRDSIESSPTQSIPPTAAQSPISSMRPRGSISSVEVSRAGKSLFAELGGSFMSTDGDDLDDEQSTPIKSGFGSPLRKMVDAACNTEVPYPEDAVTLAAPATPPPRPAVSESWTQSTPHQRPAMLESWTQSTPIRRVTFAESGTQATPARRPAMAESATQFTPRPRAILFDSATQFTPITYSESSVQPDDVPKPAIVPMGVQSDEPLRALNISTGIQFEGLPNLKADKPPSPISQKPIMVDTPSSPIKEDKPRMVYESTGIQSDEEVKPITSSVGIQHDETPKDIKMSTAGVQSEEFSTSVMVSSGVQSDVEPKPEMSEIGTQFDDTIEPKLEMSETGTQSDDIIEPKPEMSEIGTQSDDTEPVKVTETGTQFDPEVEKELSDIQEIIPELAEAEMVSAGTQYELALEEGKDTAAVLAPVEEMVVAKVDSGTQSDSIEVQLPVLTAASSQTDPIEIQRPMLTVASSQTDPEPEPIQNLSISVSEVAKQEPVEFQERMSFSEIISQDIAPVDPEPKMATLPRALPPIPVPLPAATELSTSSDEETPKKVSESVELSRERPITPSPQNGERPSFFGSLFRKNRGDIELENTVQDKGKEVDRRPPMIDRSVQTVITYETTDKILRPVLVGLSTATSSSSNHPAYNPPALHPPRTSSIQPVTSYDPIAKGKSTIRLVESNSGKRPGSSNSSRSFIATHPPLPEDHREAIAAAQNKGNTGFLEPTNVFMGPPLVPASAKSSVSFRPKTPVNGMSAHIPDESPTSKGGSTPRPRMSQATMRSEFASPPSHRSSMSSFASELDDRFRINDENNSQHQLQNDPRIIQAITQTMIGEYLWKYTRSATKSSLSSNRHRRFFWVHPYTRTLYWSEKDPSTAGKHELRAKSVSIEAVRVITDDNPLPPGLHRKSLVVITPGRTIQFTAPTGQRHETWYMALSYLLTRKMEEEGNEEAEEPPNQQQHQQDTHDDAPYTGPRAASSLSFYNTRSNRHTSPVRNASSLSHRRPPPQTNPHGSMSRLTRVFKPGSYTSKSSRHTSISTAAALSMYDASEANDSIEDMRLEIERQEREADRMEYVRACCDGKHDVGTLPRKGGLRTLRGRRGLPTDHHHSHTHTQQGPQPQYARHYYSDSTGADQVDE